MEELNTVYKGLTSTAGASIDAWNTDYLPPEEWAHEIFMDAHKNAVMLPLIRRYDSPRKITIPVKSLQATTWQSTVATTVVSNGEQSYGASGIALDPTEYRTYMHIAMKSLEEATWAVEADARERLATAVGLKLDTEIYSCLDGSALSSGDFQTAGESLTNTNTSYAVDWGTALSVDNIIDAIYNVRAASDNYYHATDLVVTPGMVKGLVKESTFRSAAEWGNRSVLESGEFSKFMGCNVHVTSNIPQDSGSTDIGLCFDRKAFLLGNVPHELQIEAEKNRPTDEMWYYAKLKCAFSVGDSEAGVVFYT